MSRDLEGKLEDVVLDHEGLGLISSEAVAAAK